MLCLKSWTISWSRASIFFFFVWMPDAHSLFFFRGWRSMNVKASIQGACLQERKEGWRVVSLFCPEWLSAGGTVVVLLLPSTHLPQWPEPLNPSPTQKVPGTHIPQSASWSLTWVLFTTFSWSQSAPPDTLDQLCSDSIISLLAARSSSSSCSWCPLILPQWNLCILPVYLHLPLNTFITNSKLLLKLFVHLERLLSSLLSAALPQAKPYIHPRAAPEWASFPVFEIHFCLLSEIL